MSYEESMSVVFQSLQAACDHLRVARNVLETVEYDDGQVENEVVNLIDILNALIPYGQDLSCITALNDRVSKGGDTRDFVFGE